MKHYNLMAAALTMVWACGGEPGRLSTGGDEPFIPIETSLPDTPVDEYSPWLVSSLTVEDTQVDFIGLPMEERSSMMMRISGKEGATSNPVLEVQAGSPDVPLTYAETFGGLTDHLVDLPAELAAFHFVQADTLGRGYDFIDAVRTPLPEMAVEKARGVFSPAFDQAFDAAVPAFRAIEQQDSAQICTLDAGPSPEFQFIVWGCTGYTGILNPFYKFTSGARFPNNTDCPRRKEWVRIGVQNLNWETNNPQAFSVVQTFGPPLQRVNPFTANPGSWYIFDWADPALKYQAISAHRGNDSPQTIARFRTALYVPR